MVNYHQIWRGLGLGSLWINERRETEKNIGERLWDRNWKSMGRDYGRSMGRDYGIAIGRIMGRDILNWKFKWGERLFVN